MTSVPSHRPLLSGSKYLSVLIVIFVLFSCDPTKRARKTEYPDKPRWEQGQTPKPKEDKPVVVTKPKTIEPKTTPKTPDRNGRYADGQVNVALLLPFLTNKFSSTASSIDPKSDIAIQFYAGFNLAMEEATLSGASIHVSVLDTKASLNETKALVDNPIVNSADIIIGPFRKKNVNFIADYACRNGQVMFSPFRDVSPAGVAGKGYVIQMFAGLDTYMTGIVDFLVSEKNTENVVVLKRKNGADDRAVASLNKAYGIALEQHYHKPLKEVEVDSEDLAFKELDLKGILQLNPKTVFIVPVWKGANYVTSIIRKVFVSRNKEENVLPTMIGMPQWISFKNIDFAKLNALNTLIPSADVVNTNRKTSAFAKRYFAKFSSLPNKHAYKGYDVGQYLLQFVTANTAGGFSVPDSKDLFLEYQFDQAAVNSLNEQPIIFRNKAIKVWRLENYKLVD